jgi:hypothetical protein
MPGVCCEQTLYQAHSPAPVAVSSPQENSRSGAATISTLHMISLGAGEELAIRPCESMFGFEVCEMGVVLLMLDSAAFSAAMKYRRLARKKGVPLDLRREERERPHAFGPCFPANASPAGSHALFSLCLSKMLYGQLQHADESKSQRGRGERAHPTRHVTLSGSFFSWRVMA